MIGADAARARRLTEGFLSAVGADTDPLLHAFNATHSDPGFPGALFAWPRGAGQAPVFYAAAGTQAQWRRLRPLLLAFAGPTLTDFAGAPTHLDMARPHERVLSGAGLAAVVRLVPAGETAESTVRALKRLAAMVARTPADAGPPAETTGRLLARIRDDLNAMAINDARRLLERCRSEHRLDALNLKFLDIEILTTAHDWHAIAELGGFDDLTRARRPPAVTAALLEALYWSAFGDAPPDAQGYARGPRPRARDLIRLPAPPAMRRGAWRLYSLEALAVGAPQGRALAEAALASGADLGSLADALAAVVAAPASSVAPELAPDAKAAEAGAALIGADLSGSLSAVDHARALLSRLTDAERTDLLRSDQPRRALTSIAETFGEASAPAGWTAWLAALADGAFTTALAVARQGAQEWGAGLGDPVDIAALSEALMAVPDEPPSSDRLADGLPHLVAWLQRDPDFPRAAGYPAYESALDRLMLGGRAAAPMLRSAGVLAKAMLSIGPTPAAYRRLLADLLEFSGQGAGARTSYWLIELLEETVSASAPDQDARDRFWRDALARLVPIAQRLSSLQRASLVRLAAGLGGQPTLPAALAMGPGIDVDDDLARRLAGKMVAVYTLTETAAKQARDVLRSLVPDLDVRVSSDHGGSRALRALAENADLFVIVAASATHAATDFIRARRADRPLAYAAGRGSVSILRAVEEWAFRADGGDA